MNIWKMQIGDNHPEYGGILFFSNKIPIIKTIIFGVLNLSATVYLLWTYFFNDGAFISLGLAIIGILAFYLIIFGNYRAAIFNKGVIVHKDKREIIDAPFSEIVGMNLNSSLIITIELKNGKKVKIENNNFKAYGVFRQALGEAFNKYSSTNSVSYPADLEQHPLNTHANIEDLW